MKILKILIVIYALVFSSTIITFAQVGIRTDLGVVGYKTT